MRAALESISRVDELNQLGMKHGLFGVSTDMSKFSDVTNSLMRFIEVSGFVAREGDDKIHLVIKATDY